MLVTFPHELYKFVKARFAQGLDKLVLRGDKELSPLNPHFHTTYPQNTHKKIFVVGQNDVSIGF